MRNKIKSNYKCNCKAKGKIMSKGLSLTLRVKKTQIDRQSKRHKENEKIRNIFKC